MTSWLPISSLGNSASGIHIKRSLLLDGFTFVFFYTTDKSAACASIHLQFGNQYLSLTGSFSAGPTAWPLVLSEGPPLQGLPDTPFTFLWMWHSSRRAGDPLLGLCHRSARGSASSFARQKLPMQGPDELWGVLQVFSVYKAHAKKAKQKSKEQ